MAREVANLNEMIDRMDDAPDRGGRVSVDVIVKAVGARSFGPLLLLAGLVMVSPLSGIPGVPTTMSVFVLLIAFQLLLGRPCCWLPRWLLRRSIARNKFDKALEWLRPPARFVDRWLQPRWTRLVGGGARYLIAAVCVLIASGIPFMEVVPFSATAAGVALTAFGLSLIAHDGVLALAAFATTAMTGWLIASRFI